MAAAFTGPPPEDQCCGGRQPLPAFTAPTQSTDFIAIFYGFTIID
jgi:hypothetical protein